jgi:hypothetical protein
VTALPASKVFLRRLKVRVVLLSFTDSVPVAVLKLAIQAGAVITRESRAMYTSVCVSTVKVYRGSAAAFFESTAVRSHSAPSKVAGTAVHRYPRSPKAASPTARSPWKLVASLLAWVSSTPRPEASRSRPRSSICSR